MPYIEVKDLPGIRALLDFRPETARPLGELTNILLRDTEGLSPAERELIATYVSYLNDCFYCHHSHGEIACIYLDGNSQLVEQVRKDFNKAAISEKLKSLLAIAAKVQQGGKFVTETHIEKAKQNGATDRDIHDTILIAAAFCMFNRYVDGLGTSLPVDASYYRQSAQHIVEHGYAATTAVDVGGGGRS